MSMVRVENVTKIFRKGSSEIRPLDGIGLEVQKGEFVCLMGPSGSGKTTLLNLVAGIDKPTSGHVYVDGEEVAGMSESALAKWRTRSIGYVFQLYNLIPVLSAFENVELPLTYRGTPSAERKQKVHDALERVGMAHRMKHYPSQLSGGQQQRAAVARAVAGDPRILLADEPTGNLDSSNGAGVMELLLELHRGGTTICMVTHDEGYARQAGRTVHLLDGRIVDVNG